jgi:hypothetical protein
MPQVLAKNLVVGQKYLITDEEGKLDKTPQVFKGFKGPDNKPHMYAEFEKGGYTPDKCKFNSVSGGKRKSRKQSGGKHKTRKQSGGYRVLYGKITDSTGKVYDDGDFMEDGDAQWQEINALLSNHVRTHVNDEDVLQDGFGGDDGSGYIVLKTKSTVPPLTFTMPRTYTIKFDRIENENNNGGSNNRSNSGSSNNRSNRNNNGSNSNDPIAPSARRL